jgi:acetylornithine/succinyldiaminopimelate/putrescine aminotransferase
VKRRFAAGWVHMVPTEHLLPVYGTRPLLVERGEGCYVFDAEGRRYLDVITGIGVNALGYGHPALVTAIREQATMCVHSSNLHRHPYQEALAARLAAWSGLDLVFLSNSGTEAMEAALKAARARANALGRRRQRIVALEGSFHGRSAGALAVTGQGKYRDPFGPLTPDVVFVGANDMAALRAAVNEETIAIVAETILGEGGVVPLTAEFLEGIRGLATRREALWIADETQCGLGRTGERFAYQRFGLLPDVVVTAKPLGGGLPLGATMFSAEAGAALGQGMHGTTFGGGPLACRVAGKGPDGGFGTGRAGGAGGGTGARGGVDHQLHAGECAAISAAVCGGAGGDRFCLRGGAG